MNANAFVGTMLFISKSSWFQAGLWSRR